MGLQYNFHLRNVVLLACLCVGAPLYAAEDVRITVNGRVIARPCVVSTENVNVNFDNVLTTDLYQAGAQSETKEISLNLINCPLGTSSIAAKFTGDIDSTNYFKNNGTASNVQIQLLDSADSDKNIVNNFTKNIAVNNTTATVTIPLKVRLLSVNGNATAGSVQSIISVTYTYN